MDMRSLNLLKLLEYWQKGWNRAEESDFVKQGASKKEKFTELMLSQRVLSLCFDKTSSGKNALDYLTKKEK